MDRPAADISECDVQQQGTELAYNTSEVPAPAVNDSGDESVPLLRRSAERDVQQQGTELAYNTSGVPVLAVNDSGSNESVPLLRFPLPAADNQQQGTELANNTSGVPVLAVNDSGDDSGDEAVPILQLSSTNLKVW